jgi:hypothetical protein
LSQLNHADGSNEDWLAASITVAHAGRNGPPYATMP